MSTFENALLAGVTKEDWEATSSFVERHGSLKWKIENFSIFLNEGIDKIFSPSFKCASSTWRLILYPHSTDTIGKEFVTASLTRVSPQTRKKVRCKIYLEDRSGDNRFITKDEGILDISRVCLGNLSLIDRKTLLAGKTQLLHDDVLTVCVELSVWEHIAGDDAKRVDQRTTYKSNSIATTTIPKAIEILVKDVEALLKEQKDCDVTLQVGEKKFPAHKLLLRARSKVFAAMFKHDMKESQSNVVSITDMEPAIMTDLLRYIYAGNVGDMSVEKATALYIAADKYALSELKSQCAYIIQKNLTVENACDAAVLADAHNDGMIIDFLKIFVRKNTMLLSTEKWKRMAEGNPRLAYEITLALTLELALK